MDRIVFAELSAWKTDTHRKPLILQGARQVGKTWLLKEFGRREYDRTIYLSLDESPVARSIFEQDLDVRRIVADIATLDGRGPIDPDNTLLIFDEVQEAPRALTSLKYFNENAPQYHVASAGSLLGVASHSGTSFPVGQVSFIQVHPLTFVEFLDGIGEAGMATLLRDGDPARFAPFHDLLVNHLRSFLFVGGMPEAVTQYAANRDFAAARAVHSALLSAYDRDFSKHAPLAEVPRLRALFESAPQQLARENKRFFFRQAQPGAGTSRMELAMQWLKDAGLVRLIRRVQVPRIPLTAYADQAFKLYLLDVGLVGAAVGLESRTLLEGSAAFTEYKGALTEQLVLQELIAAGLNPFYWTNSSGNAEVDFLVDRHGEIVPIEVKAEVNLQAKSLRVYRDAYKPAKSLRLSLRPYRDEGWLTNLPLYAAGLVTSGG